MSDTPNPQPMMVGGRKPPPNRQSLHPSMTVVAERPAPKPGEPAPESTLFPPGAYQKTTDRSVPPAAPPLPVSPSQAPPAPTLPLNANELPSIIGAPPPPEKITGRTIVNDVRAAARPPEVAIRLDRTAGPSHVRLTLPSAGVFYPWTDFQVRPFGVRDLAGLARARKSGDISQQLDVLDGCMTQNVRELTIPDLRFVMYWLKLNSYMRTPFDVEWTSKYGNLNIHTIKSTDLVIDVLEMSRERADRWLAYGISPSRVRDMEIFETETLDDETLWLYERAQFMSGSTLEEKIQNLERGGIDVLERIREFDAAVKYGVEESFTARDQHFTVDGWIAALREESGEIERRMKIITDVQMATSMVMRIQDINDEIAQLEARVARGEEVVADEEKRIMNISFGDFFSGI